MKHIFYKTKFISIEHKLAGYNVSTKTKTIFSQNPTPRGDAPQAEPTNHVSPRSVGAYNFNNNSSRSSLYSHPSVAMLNENDDQMLLKGLKVEKKNNTQAKDDE